MSSSYDNTSTTKCSIMHSYPFINDDPKVKKSKKTPEIQLPIGVLHIKPSWKPVKLDEKPPFSYATIIAHAILSSEQRKLTLSEIYQWISEQYPCYSMKDHRWQNSIRHNLSLQKAFAKLDRDSTTPSGKGCYWTILPGYEQQFIDNLVKRGGLRASSSSVRPNTHKQFKKFIHSNQSNNTHLFTIFRMNPAPSSPPPCKKKENSQTRRCGFRL